MTTIRKVSMFIAKYVRLPADMYTAFPIKNKIQFILLINWFTGKNLESSLSYYKPTFYQALDHCYIGGEKVHEPPKREKDHSDWSEYERTGKAWERG